MLARSAFAGQSPCAARRTPPAARALLLLPAPPLSCWPRAGLVLAVLTVRAVLALRSPSRSLVDRKAGPRDCLAEAAGRGRQVLPLTLRGAAPPRARPRPRRCQFDDPECARRPNPLRREPAAAGLPWLPGSRPRLLRPQPPFAAHGRHRDPAVEQVHLRGNRARSLALFIGSVRRTSSSARIPTRCPKTRARAPVSSSSFRASRGGPSSSD